MVVGLCGDGELGGLAEARGHVRLAMKARCGLGCTCVQALPVRAHGQPLWVCLLAAPVAQAVAVLLPGRVLVLVEYGGFIA
jgi:hypothetical protein